MTGPQASAPGSRRGILLPLHREASGRYRASSDAIGTASDPLLQEALRDLLDRSASLARGMAEIGGRLYETSLRLPAADPDTAYAETDADCVPLDNPAAPPIQPQFPDYVASLRERCSVSDALTPDTSIPLAAAFIPPVFEPAGPEPAGEGPVTFAELGGFPRVVITGPPGAGKTSCIRRIALDLTAGGAAAADTLPVLIQLRSLTADDFAADGLPRLITAGTGPGLAAELKPPMNGGRLLLLIDGLDELSGPVEQEQLLDRLASLCRELPRVRVVLTTRDPVSLHALDDFTQLRIQPFSTSQMHQWTRHYLRVHNPGHSRWADFLDLLHYDRRFSELVSNPLLLGLASSLHWKYPDELNNRAGLLRKCIDVLIQDWDAARGIARWRASEVTPRQVKRILNRLAVPIGQRPRDGFTLDHADQEVAGLTGFREPAAILLWASETSGLVTRSEGGTYSFTHSSFADYFAASDVVRRTESVSEAIREASQTDDGSNFWRLACALTSDADILLDGVLSYAADDERAAAFMMAQALGEEVSATVGVVEECSRRVVAALEARLSAAEPLPEGEARQPWADDDDRSVVWADGVTGGRTPDTAESFRTSARLLELIFRARTGSAREYVRYCMEESVVPLLRHAAAALKADGWLDYAVREAGGRTALFVAVTQSASPEARRMVARPALLSDQPPDPQAGPPAIT